MKLAATLAVATLLALAGPASAMSGCFDSTKQQSAETKVPEAPRLPTAGS